MIIGTRNLIIETEDDEVQAQARLYAPVFEDPKWVCRIEIELPDERREGTVEGNDALHAIQFGLHMLGMELYSTKWHRERRMHWIKPWVGYGFEVPKGARDMLIGDDAKYYGE